MRTVIILALTLTGCAGMPFQTMQSKLDQHRGEDINDAIMRLGPPTKTFQMTNGLTAYSWSKVNRSYSSDYVGGVDQTETTCSKTYFVDSSNKIVSAKFSCH